jgi:hypothetical protein
MFPVYWQGSVIGAVMGLIVLAVFLTWLIRSKAEWMAWITPRTRWVWTFILPVVWLLTFVNVGVHNTEGDRARFDQVGTLTEKSTPVKHETASPQSAKEAAAALRKEIDAGNLNK